MDKDFLITGFEACLVTKPLRYEIGTKVEANVGTFREGTILKQWDDGNAYRIKLSDGTEVWAPIDIDVYVRKANKA